jgi:hypothetical protein
MDQPNLPRHVVERGERRWAGVLSHQATLRPKGTASDSFHFCSIISTSCVAYIPMPC